MKILFLLCVILASCHADPKAEQPIELGTVTWSRDLPATLQEARKSGKPVFLLFQEVPG